MNRPRGNRLWLALGFGVATIFAIATAIRALGPSPTPGSPEAVASVSRTVFDRLGTQRIDEPSEVLARFLSGGVGNESALPGAGRDRVREEALEQVAALFSSRFGGEGPAAYLSEWESLGYRVVSREELDSRMDLGAYYEFVVGEPLPENAGVRDIFSAIWEAAKSVDDGSIRLTSIAANPTGIHTVFYRMNATFERTETLHNESIDETGWYGGIAQACPMWISAPTTIDERFKAGQESVLIAETGVVCGFASGGRRVLNVIQFWDPSRGRWWVFSVNANNFTTTLGGPCF